MRELGCYLISGGDKLDGCSVHVKAFMIELRHGASFGNGNGDGNENEGAQISSWSFLTG